MIINQTPWKAQDHKLKLVFTLVKNIIATVLKTNTGGGKKEKKNRIMHNRRRIQIKNSPDRERTAKSFTWLLKNIPKGK